MNQKILVTGGNSMVGKHLKKYLPDAKYISSSDCDLTSQYQIDYMFDQYRPDVVIHMAALVGGIIDNINKPVDYYEENSLMNLNIVRASYRAGVTKFIGLLSTCIYPDQLPIERYPLSECDIYNGPPTKTNFGYGYSKRMLGLQLDLYRQQYGLDYSYIIPCNLYSEYDNSSHDKSHYVTSLLRKLKESYNNKTTSINLMGDGSPTRQFMYADDLAKIISIAISKGIYDNYNMCPDNALTIREIAEVAIKSNNLDIRVNFDHTKPNGQQRKDASNKKFRAIYPNFVFTSLEDGLKYVYDKISQ